MAMNLDPKVLIGLTVLSIALIVLMILGVNGRLGAVLGYKKEELDYFPILGSKSGEHDNVMLMRPPGDLLLTSQGAGATEDTMRRPAVRQGAEAVTRPLVRQGTGVAPTYGTSNMTLADAYSTPVVITNTDITPEDASDIAQVLADVDAGTKPYATLPMTVESTDSNDNEVFNIPGGVLYDFSADENPNASIASAYGVNDLSQVVRPAPVEDSRVGPDTFEDQYQENSMLLNEAYPGFSVTDYNDPGFDEAELMNAALYRGFPEDSNVSKNKFPDLIRGPPSNVDVNKDGYIDEQDPNKTFPAQLRAY